METKKGYNQPVVSVLIMEKDAILLSENPSVEDVEWYTGGESI